MFLTNEDWKIQEERKRDEKVMVFDSLVSVIVPAYNCEKHIEKCVDSLINQTYKNIEIIIVDDGSTDNTYGIIERLKKEDMRIKAFKKENGGVSSARNVGMDHAGGDIMRFAIPMIMLKVHLLKAWHHA